MKAAELATVDGGANPPDTGHQARAVPDRDGDAEFLLEILDLEPVLERARDRLLGVDVLAGAGHLERDRQVLLVGDGEDHALDLRIAQHGGKLRHRRHPGLARKSGALVLGAAEAGRDLDALRARRRAREHTRPATQTDDAYLDGIGHDCTSAPQISI
jgi:hypothetical protein